VLDLLSLGKLRRFMMRNVLLRQKTKKPLKFNGFFYGLASAICLKAADP
jgi:hypothetical protein